MRTPAMQADTGYKIGGVRGARLCRHSGMRLLAQARNPYSRWGLWIPGSRFARPGMTTSISSHRHFAMQHGRAGGQAFGRINDGVGVDAVVAIEIIDGA